MTPIVNPIDGLGDAAASVRGDAAGATHRVIDSQTLDADPARRMLGYQPPRVEPLGHWQVHTMDTYSIDILP